MTDANRTGRLRGLVLFSLIGVGCTVYDGSDDAVLITFDNLDTLAVNIVELGDVADASNRIEPGSSRSENFDVAEGESLTFQALRDGSQLGSASCRLLEMNLSPRVAWTPPNLLCVDWGGAEDTGDPPGDSTGDPTDDPTEDVDFDWLGNWILRLIDGTPADQLSLSQTLALTNTTFTQVTTSPTTGTCTIQASIDSASDTQIATTITSTDCPGSEVGQTDVAAVFVSADKITLVMTGETGNEFSYERE